MKFAVIVFSAALTGSALGLAHAQTTELNNEATRMNNLAASQGETKVVNKISGDFSPFLGANSKAVVTGLRNGTPIILTNTTTTAGAAGAPAVTTANTTLINPPTGKMGFGNVYISLALAKQQLNTLGITQPTAEQLQAALTGGPVTLNTAPTTAGTMASTTTLDGILTMRNQHMGWGQIAQKLNFKLGPVISGMKHSNETLTTTASPTSSTTASANAQSSKSSETRIISGTGQSQGNSEHGISNGKGSSDGIVTASGRSNANSYGQGRNGIVTGSGHSAGANGALSNGASNANSGHGKGAGK